MIKWCGLGLLSVSIWAADTATVTISNTQNMVDTSSMTVEPAEKFSETHTFSLIDCVNYGMKHAPAVREQRLRYDDSRLDVRIQRAVFTPISRSIHDVMSITKTLLVAPLLTKSCPLVLT